LFIKESISVCCWYTITPPTTFGGIGGVIFVFRVVAMGWSRLYKTHYRLVFLRLTVATAAVATIFYFWPRLFPFFAPTKRALTYDTDFGG
jgi:hypothetical protein